MTQLKINKLDISTIRVFYYKLFLKLLKAMKIHLCKLFINWMFLVLGVDHSITLGGGEWKSLSEPLHDRHRQRIG